jgi:hypothetical protein
MSPFLRTGEPPAGFQFTPSAPTVAGRERTANGLLEEVFPRSVASGQRAGKDFLTQHWSDATRREPPAPRGRARVHEAELAQDCLL